MVDRLPNSIFRRWTTRLWIVSNLDNKWTIVVVVVVFIFVIVTISIIIIGITDIVRFGGRSRIGGHGCVRFCLSRIGRVDWSDITRSGNAREGIRYWR